MINIQTLASNGNRNPWLNPAEMASVKSASALVINKTVDDETTKTNVNLVENLVVANRIPIKKSFEDNDGNLVVVCNSTEARDELKNQVAASNEDIRMKDTQRKKWSNFNCWIFSKL